VCLAKGAVLKEPSNKNPDRWPELTSEAGALHTRIYDSVRAGEIKIVIYWLASPVTMGLDSKQ
jgi:hypothetical protein